MCTALKVRLLTRDLGGRYVSQTRGLISAASTYLPQDIFYNAALGRDASALCGGCKSSRLTMNRKVAGTGIPVP